MNAEDVKLLRDKARPPCCDFCPYTNQQIWFGAAPMDTADLYDNNHMCHFSIFMNKLCGLILVDHHCGLVVMLLPLTQRARI